MAGIDSESSNRAKNKLRVDLLDKVELYQIMCEVFFSYIPKEDKLDALSYAADRIFKEVKDSHYENTF